MIYQICDVTMWDNLHFQYIFWIITDEITKLGQLIDISKGNNFQQSFEQFGGLGLGSYVLFFLKGE